MGTTEGRGVMRRFIDDFCFIDDFHEEDRKEFPDESQNNEPLSSMSACGKNAHNELVDSDCYALTSSDTESALPRLRVSLQTPKAAVHLPRPAPFPC